MTEIELKNILSETKTEYFKKFSLDYQNLAKTIKGSNADDTIAELMLFFFDKSTEYTDEVISKLMLD